MTETNSKPIYLETIDGRTAPEIAHVFEYQGRRCWVRGVSLEIAKALVKRLPADFDRFWEGNAVQAQIFYGNGFGINGIGERWTVEVEVLNMYGFGIDHHNIARYTATGLLPVLDRTRAIDHAAWLATRIDVPATIVMRDEPEEVPA